MAKKTTKTTPQGGPSNEQQYGVSFDPFVRSDKLQAWLDANPGLIPSGMTEADVAEALRPLDDPNH